MSPNVKHIFIIINPAAGKLEPILPVLNDVFKDTGIKWDVMITKEAGDGTRFAKDAVRKGADAVGVYGGDGTLMEAVSGLIGTDIPLAIFPGGTANVMATELEVPKNLRESCQMLCQGKFITKSIDVGQFNDRYFILRTSLGFEADMVKGADRKVKNKFGLLAYVFAAADAFKKLQESTYYLKIDGRDYQVKGLTCIVANSGNLGFSHLTLDQKINVTDGLLDVIVVRRVNFNAFGQLIATLFRKELPHNVELVEQWQGKEITVTAKPKQTLQCDGEIIKSTTFTAKILPGAIRIFVPAPPQV